MLLSLYITARYVCVTRRNTQMNCVCLFLVSFLLIESLVVLFKEFFKGVLILESDTDLDSRRCKTSPHMDHNQKLFILPLFVS